MADYKAEHTTYASSLIWDLKKAVDCESVDKVRREYLSLYGDSLAHDIVINVVCNDRMAEFPING